MVMGWVWRFWGLLPAASLTTLTLCCSTSSGGTSVDGGTADDAGTTDAAGPAVDASPPEDASTEDTGVPDAISGEFLPAPPTWDPAPVTVDACTEPAGVILTATAASAIVADPAHVYYADRGELLSCGPRGCQTSGGAVYRIPRCGGSPEQMLPGPEKVRRLLDGGNVVYVLREAIGAPLVRIDKLTGAATELDLCADAAAASVAELYYYDSCRFELDVLAHDAAVPTPLSPSPLRGVTHLAVTAAHLYYSQRENPQSDTLVYRRALPSGPTTEIRRTSLTTSGLAATSTHAFISENQSTPSPLGGTLLVAGDVLRVPVATGIAETLWPIAFGAPLLADTDEIYFQVGGIVPWPNAALDGGVRSVTTAVAGEPPILRGNNPFDVEGGRVYWSEWSYLLTKPAAPERADAPEGPSSPPLRSALRPPEPEIVNQVVATPDGGFAVGGRGHVARFDADWNRLYSFEAGGLSSPSFLAVDALGDYYVARPPTLGRYAASDGTLVWSVPLDGAAAFAATSDGRTVISAGTFGTGATSRIESHSPSGEFEWTRSMGVHDALELIVDADGATYGTGRWRDDDAVLVRDFRSFVFKLRADGALEWQTSLLGVQTRQLAVDALGHLIVIAAANGWYDVGRGTEVVPVPGRENTLVLHYDAAGSLGWVRRFEGEARWSAVDPTGGLVIGGGHDQHADMFALAPAAPRYGGDYLVHLDENGDYQWSRTWPDPLDEGADITFTAGGELLLVGYAASPFELAFAELAMQP